LQPWLDSLEWQAVLDDYERGDGVLDLEPWTWTYDDWQIDFRPIPKASESRGLPDLTPVGASGSGGWQFVDDASPIRRSIRKKATRYGEPDLPFVVAVMVLSLGVDDTDVMSALFGNEVVRITGPKPKDYVLDRERNGAWISTGGWRNTRVSATLIAQGLQPWTAGMNSLALWHHPQPSRPLTMVAGPWRTLVPSGSGQMQEDPAPMQPHEVLRLADPWPQGPIGLA
jgi:hypothetical protein